MDDFKHPEIEGAIELEQSDLNNDPKLQQIDECHKYDPTHDKHDMRRLGRVQEMKRRFRFFSIVGYMVILATTWEAALITSVFALSSGGTGGAIWTTLAACFGQLSSTISMAEMASISPTAGGQYHWVSEFGPRKYQKSLSYTIGWLCALGWQTAMPTVAYTAGLQVIFLIAVCSPGFVAQGWHFALLMIAFSCFALLVNLFAVNILPLAERIVVVIHLCGFVIFITIFGHLGLVIHTGLATLVSLVGPSSALIGADAAVHLAEELKDASYRLPRAMVSSAVINYITSFVMVVSLVSAIGPDLDKILLSPTYQPWVAVIQAATGSKAATIILLCLVIFQLSLTSINQATTSSRQMWAFARDKGVPFDRSLSKVNPKDVPRTALIVTLCTTIVLALIVIGSTIAFNNILSICNVSLIISYIFCIATLVGKRLRGEKLPPSRFDLGRWGLPINCVALGWLSSLAIFPFFPAAPDPSPAAMNWACLMFGAVVIFAFGWYLVRGRHEYDGPVEYIRKDM